MNRLLIIAALNITAIVAVSACDDKADASDKPADNTKVNERDKDTSAKTPGDQGQGKADIDITASIRKSVVADDALSTNAKNVKIITEGGVVTLRGPVASEDEKTKIASLARSTPGVERVEDQLEIAAP